jgi:hypothetical protein
MEHNIIIRDYADLPKDELSQARMQSGLPANPADFFQK